MRPPVEFRKYDSFGKQQQSDFFIQVLLLRSSSKFVLFSVFILPRQVITKEVVAILGLVGTQQSNI